MLRQILDYVIEELNQTAVIYIIAVIAARRRGAGDRSVRSCTDRLKPF